MPPTQVTAGTDAISDHRREGTAREWEAGLIPHKLLLEVFFVARDLKKKKGQDAGSVTLSVSRGMLVQSYQALHQPSPHTCWISGAGGLKLEPAGEGTVSACTDLTIVLEMAGWLQPQLVTWECPPEQSVSQTRVGGYATATSLPRGPRAIEQPSNRFLLSYVCAFSQRFAQLLRVGWR